MPEEVCIREENIEEHVSGIKGASALFAGKPLEPCDTRSTIHANQKGQEAYGSARGMTARFGKSLEQEAADIKSLGLTFAEYDKMLAGLWKRNAGKQEAVTLERHRIESGLGEEEGKEEKP